MAYVNEASGNRSEMEVVKALVVLVVTFNYITSTTTWLYHWYSQQCSLCLLSQYCNINTKIVKGFAVTWIHDQWWNLILQRLWFSGRLLQFQNYKTWMTTRSQIRNSRSKCSLQLIYCFASECCFILHKYSDKKFVHMYKFLVWCVCQIWPLQMAPVMSELSGVNDFWPLHHTTECPESRFTEILSCDYQKM
jgi:hypothetical protein